MTPDQEGATPAVPLRPHHPHRQHPDVDKDREHRPLRYRVLHLRGETGQDHSVPSFAICLRFGVKSRLALLRFVPFIDEHSQ